MTAPQAPPVLPDPRIVPVTDLSLHEKHDAQRSERWRSGWSTCRRNQLSRT
jgi:hypothetical protein